jgi:undecaprenyl-diphosphatase
MALPAIAGAAVLQIPEISSAPLEAGWGPLAVSFVAALGSGIVAIRFLIHLLRVGVFHRFAPYCVSIGVVTILWAVLG